jgi:hypothetical protein
MKDGQSFTKAVSNVDVGDAMAAGAVSTIIPGGASVMRVGYQGTKSVASSVKAIRKISEKSANTANRAERNAAAISRNVENIKTTVADVGQAGGTATASQLVTGQVQSLTPESKVSDLK